MVVGMMEAAGPRFLAAEPAFIMAAAAAMLVVAALFIFLDASRPASRAFALLLFLYGALRFLRAFSQTPSDLAGVTLVYPWLALPFAILYFAYAYLVRTRGAFRAGRGAARLIPITILVLALAVQAAYFLDHSLYVSEGPAGFYGQPLYFLTESTNVLLALAGLVFIVGYVRSTKTKLSKASLLVGLGFLLQQAYLYTFFAVMQLDRVNRGLLNPSEILTDAREATWFLLLASVLLVVTLAVAILVRHAVGTRDRDLRRDAGWSLAAIGVAAVFGAMLGAGMFVLGDMGRREAAFSMLLLHRIVFNLWLLTLPALVGYALLKYHLFNIDLHTKQAIRYGTVAGAGLTVFFAAFLVAILVLPPPWAALLAAVATLALLPARHLLARMSQRLADRLMPNVQRTPEYLLLRNYEVYQAALEEAVATDGLTDGDHPHLADLRRRLGVSDREHRFLLHLVQGQRRLASSTPRAVGTRFRIERELGRGTYGRALLAHDAVLERRVVLKQPLAAWLHDPHLKTRFLEEAKAAARIHHPHVVTLFEVLPEEDPPVLVFEHVDGENLDQRLGRGRRLHPDDAVRTTLDILSGLEAVHAAGLVHRDLKPANILLTRDGTAKITDFGVAGPSEPPDAQATMAWQSYQPGSLAYMSPEQAAGGPVDARSDLYSVGVLLHRMLTGRHYLRTRGEPDYRIRKRILEEPPTIQPGGVAAPIVKFLTQALAKDPADRPASAATMARQLQKAAKAARAADRRSDPGAAPEPVGTPRHA